ncbi:MAG: HTH-type transcriptional repressor FabR [Nevskiales bacterium]
MKPADLATSATSARKTHIGREDLIAAALKLLGPHRSVSTLSLREVARAAGIAPNSFYRHFRDVDELAVALIDQAGASLRKVIREARLRISKGEGSVIRPSVEAFMDQLEADKKLLHILMREGTVGSNAFKQAVEHELRHFEEELRVDLIRLSAANGDPIYRPELVARAITRLTFAVGGAAMDLPAEQRALIKEDIVEMVKMIMAGTQTLAATEGAQA